MRLPPGVETINTHNPSASSIIPFMKLIHWIHASRPKTLPAAASPVMAATALAYHDGVFNAIPAVLCLCFALLIQVATNFANDAFDFKKGADNSDRVGPRRAVASGWISYRSMLMATTGTIALAFLCGVPLIHYGGWHLIAVGLASGACAILYTAGPFSLAYTGLADAFVMVFFGWVAVLFTYFLQAGEHSFQALLLGTSSGALSMNLLLVNNYRDYATDLKAGKKTTVVRFGQKWGRLQYTLTLSLAALMTLWLAWIHGNSFLGLPLLALIPGFRIPSRMRSAHGVTAHEKLLKQTVAILLLWTLLTALILVL